MNPSLTRAGRSHLPCSEFHGAEFSQFLVHSFIHSYDKEPLGSRWATGVKEMHPVLRLLRIWVVGLRPGPLAASHAPSAAPVSKGPIQPHCVSRAFWAEAVK